MYWFWDTTAEQAHEYCAFVKAAHPSMLRDLARELLAAGVPLARMDGSTASLVPLWQWVLDGLPDNWRALSSWGPGSAMLALGDRLDPRTSRVTLLNELISHYVFATIRISDPSVRWVVRPRTKKGPEYSDAHECTILIGKSHHSVLGRFTSVIARAIEGTEWALEPTALESLVRRAYLRGAEVAGGGFALADFVGAPDCPVPVPRFSFDGKEPPAAGEGLVTRDMFDGAVSFTVARGINSAVELEHAESLDPLRVVSALEMPFFAPPREQRRSTAEATVLAGVRFVHRDGFTVIDPVVVGGVVRGLVGTSLSDDVIVREKGIRDMYEVARLLKAEVLIDDQPLRPVREVRGVRAAEVSTVLAPAPAPAPALPVVGGGVVAGDPLEGAVSFLVVRGINSNEELEEAEALDPVRVARSLQGADFESLEDQREATAVATVLAEAQFFSRDGFTLVEPMVFDGVVRGLLGESLSGDAVVRERGIGQIYHLARLLQADVLIDDQPLQPE